MHLCCCMQYSCSSFIFCQVMQVTIKLIRLWNCIEDLILSHDTDYSNCIYDIHVSRTIELHFIYTLVPCLLLQPNVSEYKELLALATYRTINLHKELCTNSHCLGCWDKSFCPLVVSFIKLLDRSWTLWREWYKMHHTDDKQVQCLPCPVLQFHSEVYEMLWQVRALLPSSLCTHQESYHLLQVSHQNLLLLICSVDPTQIFYVSIAFNERRRLCLPVSWKQLPQSLSPC